MEQVTPNVNPDIYLLNKILRRTTDINQAYYILQLMKKFNLQPDTWTYSIVLHMYIDTFKQGIVLLQLMATPERMAKGLGPNDVFFDILARKAQSIDQVYLVMDCMDHCQIPHSVVAWNQLLRLSAHRPQAVRYYNLMKRCGIMPNVTSKKILSNKRPREPSQPLAATVSSTFKKSASKEPAP